MHEIVTAALVREGRVLLVHRSPNRRVYPDVWDLPGGHIDAGETELAALAREMHEELGVRIATGSAIHLCGLEVGRGDESVRFSTWIVGAWEGTPTNAAPDEHDEIRWFQPKRCLRSSTNSYARRWWKRCGAPGPELQRAVIGIMQVILVKLIMMLVGPSRPRAG